MTCMMHLLHLLSSCPSKSITPHKLTKSINTLVFSTLAFPLRFSVFVRVDTHFLPQTRHASLSIPTHHHNYLFTHFQNITVLGRIGSYGETTWVVVLLEQSEREENKWIYLMFEVSGFVEDEEEGLVLRSTYCTERK